MRYSKIVFVALVVAAFAGEVWYGEAQPAGAAETIDAARYSTLQEALDAVPAEGGLVRIPPGRYVIREPLRANRGELRIEGSGAATHIVNDNTGGQPALIIRPRSYDREGSPTERRRRIWRVQLADFRVSGNPKSGDGIRAESVNEILFHNVSVDHHGGHGIEMIDCYEDPRVADSIITYNGKAGLNIITSHDIVVNGNQFEENQDAVRCIDSFNLCMNGNNIDDHLRHGVVIENTYGSVVSGNMIEECTGAGIILGRDAYGITLSSNVLAHNNGGGIDLRDAWGSTVSANTFTINPGWSLRIGPDSGRITVTGNNFSNSYLGAGKTKREEDYTVEWPKKGYAAGVLLEATSDIVLSGNIFAGLIEEAVRATEGTKRVVMTGNLSADLGRKTGGKGPAVSLGPAEEVVNKLNLNEE